MSPARCRGQHRGGEEYCRSKILAERAAWDFLAAEGGSMELTTMLPVAVLGPIMGREISGANHIVQRMLDGAMPGYPNLWIPIVDVRDVAGAHVAAMTAPGAAGRRFLLASGTPVAMKQIGAILTAHLGAAAGRVPTRTIPNVVVRIAAVFSVEFARSRLISTTSRRSPPSRPGGCWAGSHARRRRRSSPPPTA